MENAKMSSENKPLAALRHHVSGAIARGESVAITEALQRFGAVPLTPSEIWAEGLRASQAAAEAENAKLGPEGSRGLDCGFAWVTIRPARGAFVAWCKARNKADTSRLRAYGDLAYGGGWQIWYSRLHTLGTQSMSVHEAACEAFAKVLKDHGINASVGSRLD